MANILDVYDASELSVSIGKYETSAWTYTPVKFRRNISPDMPSSDRRVYDGLTLAGTKMQRKEYSMTIEQEFEGWGLGLFEFENQSGLLVKIEIVPNEGTAPTDPVRYFYNWNTEFCTWSAGDMGEVTVSLTGAFDRVETTEPTDATDWTPSAT